MSLDYYQHHAAELAARYRQVSPHVVHGEWLTLLEPWLAAAPRRMLDVGAGSGRDAAFLAGLHPDHVVMAAEPCQALAQLGEAHTRASQGHQVVWVSDALPALTRVSGPFDLILLSAVWMHLPPAVRPQALARLGELLSPQGYLVLSLRLVISMQEARERAMFPVSADEVAQLAGEAGMARLYASAPQPDAMARPELSWQSLILGGQDARLP